MTFELSAPELDATGFVTDFADLDPVGAYIDVTLDHSYLNELSVTVTGGEAAGRFFRNPVASILPTTSTRPQWASCLPSSPP